MKKHLLLWLGLSGLLLPCLMPAKSALQNKLIINEIYYDTDKKSQEWFELYNPNSWSIDLRHWSIRDSRKKIELSFSSFLVPAQSYVVISNAALSDSLKNRTVINSSLPEWNNSGDEMVLYDDSGLVSDSLIYTSDWGGRRFVSLERIQPQGAGTDPLNWQSCVDPAGHTAGRTNSVHFGKSVSRITLDISPSPFSPDEDGLDDQAAISYVLPMTRATVNLKIYDTMGRMVRYLCNSESTGAQRTVHWNGRDDYARQCRAGVYIVFLQAVEETAGVVEQAKKVFVLARRL